MKDLIRGFQEFRRTNFQQHEERFRMLAEGQRPKAVLITCCDSRVDPTLIFAAPPGDLFVIRNVANLVPPYRPDGDYHGTSAALEFAVRELGVRMVVVMGHTKCGGVHALTRDRTAEQTDFIGAWMTMAKPVLADLPRGGQPPDLRALERQVVALSLQNLRTFPWIASREQAGTLALHGLMFDVADAELYQLDEASGRFDPVSAADQG